jgi:hypothetical protein
VASQATKPRLTLAVHSEREVTARWQPQIRATARQKATPGGIVIDTRARIGYTAPVGTTDEASLRHLPVAALPPRYAARLIETQETGATNQRLRGSPPKRSRRSTSKTTGRRAGHLEEFRFTDIAPLTFELWAPRYNHLTEGATVRHGDNKRCGPPLRPLARPRRIPSAPHPA